MCGNDDGEQGQRWRPARRRCRSTCGWPVSSTSEHVALRPLRPRQPWATVRAKGHAGVEEHLLACWSARDHVACRSSCGKPGPRHRGPASAADRRPEANRRAPRSAAMRARRKAVVSQWPGSARGWHPRAGAGLRCCLQAVPGQPDGEQQQRSHAQPDQPREEGREWARNFMASADLHQPGTRVRGRRTARGRVPERRRGEPERADWRAAGTAHDLGHLRPSSHLLVLQEHQRIGWLRGRAPATAR
jgi:hypothetical protein